MLGFGKDNNTHKRKTPNISWKRSEKNTNQNTKHNTKQNKSKRSLYNRFGKKPQKDKSNLGLSYVIV